MLPKLSTSEHLSIALYSDERIRPLSLIEIIKRCLELICDTTVMTQTVPVIPFDVRHRFFLCSAVEIVNVTHPRAYAANRDVFNA